ncbi:hypothetical protein BPOR_1404g00010 [Botrytis porri]|uniref:Uncharacterized protein n=1 Tax=Botrytis porri TaxID=87229 RepID=A0A4Z1K4H6_9HELO|nr:hypothetical protein BPOR_1404g00010 [Botrytis porri]
MDPTPESKQATQISSQQEIAKARTETDDNKASSSFQATAPTAESSAVQTSPAFGSFVPAPGLATFDEIRHSMFPKTGPCKYQSSGCTENVSVAECRPGMIFQSMIFLKIKISNVILDYGQVT